MGVVKRIWVKRFKEAVDPDWRAGAHGEILSPGEVAEGDVAQLIAPEPE